MTASIEGGLAEFNVRPEMWQRYCFLCGSRRLKQEVVGLGFTNFC